MYLETTALPRRGRAYRPRTTTGCNTCRFEDASLLIPISFADQLDRIRRIKCDEARPSCGQCIRGRRTCDGYVKRSCQPPPGESKSPLSSAAISTIRTSAGTDQEWQIFDYFRCRTAPKLSGSSSSPFWDQLLLQTTHHQPAIWHAVVALGSLHRHFVENSLRKNQDQDEFATQHYVKAISLVLVPIREQGKQAADVALITCILFTCFEILRGHYNAALAHIDGGTSILSELYSVQSNDHLVISPSPYVTLPMLGQLLSSLDTQASQLLNRRPRRVNYNDTAEQRTGRDITIPPSFTHLHEAQAALECIRTCAMMAMESLPPPQPAADPPHPTSAEIKISLDLIRDSSAIRLKQWSLAFERLLSQVHKAELDEIQLKHIHILKLHRIMADLQINIDFARANRDELMWDEYTGHFEAMIENAAAVCNLEQRQTSPTFTFDTQIILPLYFVAAKCRDGHLRRMAISLLRAQQRQEGVWNSHLAAVVAEYIMRLEEDGLHGDVVAADVVRRKRVLGVEVTFDMREKRAHITYVKLKDETGIERLKESIEWESPQPRIL